MIRKTKEAVAGYIFSLPIILTVIIFTIYPIFAAFYYSFTDYNPLNARNLETKFNPQEALEFHLGVFQSDVSSVDEIKDYFDLLSFIKYDVGVNLDENKEKIVLENFDTQKLLKDFVDGKLNKEMKLSQFMAEYLKTGAKYFRRYIPNFLGLDNFKKMFNDQYFKISLFNTFFYTIIVVPVQTFLALVLAVAANSKIRGVKFFKVTFFIPSITSSAAISMIFWMIYSKPGVLNRLLGYFGFQPIAWLENPNTALPAVMLMNIWTTAGYFMITFLAGLQDIPNSIYEAARIDGATPNKIFWKIILPLLRPQILFVATMGTIGCMQVFDQIYFLIKNMRNITISFYIYKNAFEYGNMGYASALSLVLFVIILLLTFIQRKLVKETY
ncbi:carbohydrate ABC transporter permease [Thermosipho atlanticus]|uniref:ABC-type sugar transport system, permease component n=1 Tax=Thermosipho atlanticus DSM 15807 TaxID=1123380 RepID=A0A1M5TB96_9BACT|nr:sugar ABC transporter permease [Thermosipho atlanticus]SHH48012.1 ABC-type sugar transport system, permease component [Thermosipho atlanticus DSM 15807]